MTQLSPEAFAGRFKACSRTLWCIAAAVLGDRSQAEDVLQEAALIALRKLNEFDSDTTFAAWMGQIVRFVALNHRRRRTGGPVPVDPDRLKERAGEPAPGTGVLSGRGELAADQAVFDDGVMAALDTLDQTQRACLLLRVVGDLPYREISRALDIPQGTAMSHVHRARRAMGAALAAGPAPASSASAEPHEPAQRGAEDK